MAGSGRAFWAGPKAFDVSKSGQPTVYVVDDDEAVRESLRWLIESINLRVECFESAVHFLSNCPDGARGCLVLDVRMPGMSGLELQEQLGDNGISLPVLIITGHADVPMAVRALNAGATDFIEKPFNDQVLLDRIQQALQFDDDNHAQHHLRDTVHRRLGELTPRERQVLDGVAKGKPNRIIAADLELSEKTIEVHRSRLMKKMKANSVAELVRMVVLYERDGHPSDG